MPGGFFQPKAIKSHEENLQEMPSGGGGANAGPSDGPNSGPTWISRLAMNRRRPSMGFSGDVHGTSLMDDDNSNSLGNSGFVVPKTFFGSGSEAAQAESDFNHIISPGEGADHFFSVIRQQGRGAESQKFVPEDSPMNEGLESTFKNPEHGISQVVTGAVPLGDFPVATKVLNTNKIHCAFSTFSQWNVGMFPLPEVLFRCENVGR